MQLSELFAQIRGPYVAGFELALRALTYPEILVEPALRDSSGRPAVTGPLSLPCRVDVMLRTAEGVSPLRLMTPVGVAFDPIELPDWGGVCALIEPFEWFLCVERVVHPSSEPDWSAPRAWFEQAFAGTDDWISPGSAKPTGRVHDFGDPSRDPIRIPGSSASTSALHR